MLRSSRAHLQNPTTQIGSKSLSELDSPQYARLFHQNGVQTPMSPLRHRGNDGQSFWPDFLGAEGCRDAALLVSRLLRVPTSCNGRLASLLLSLTCTGSPSSPGLPFTIMRYRR